MASLARCGRAERIKLVRKMKSKLGNVGELVLKAINGDIEVLRLKLAQFPMGGAGNGWKLKTTDMGDPMEDDSGIDVWNAWPARYPADVPRMGKRDGLTREWIYDHVASVYVLGPTGGLGGPVAQEDDIAQRHAFMDRHERGVLQDLPVCWVHELDSPELPGRAMKCTGSQRWP